MGWKNKYTVTAEERIIYKRVRMANVLDELQDVLESDDRYQCLELSDEEAEAIALAYIADGLEDFEDGAGRDTLRRLVDQRHPQRRYTVEVHYCAAFEVSAKRYSEWDAHEFAKQEAEASIPGMIRVTSCNTTAIDGRPIEAMSDEHTTFYEEG